MARSKNLNIDGLSGKIGPVVIYMRNGVQVVRSLPTPNDPKSEKQLAHRMKFKLVNQGLSPLNIAIKLGYLNRKNAYRSLVGKAYNEAIEGEYPHFKLNYGKIQLAEGNVQLPQNIWAVMGEDQQSILFQWDNRPTKQNNWCRNSDRVNIVYMNESLKKVHLKSGAACRDNGRLSLQLPEGWRPEETLLWIYFSSADLQYNSDSRFVMLT